MERHAAVEETLPFADGLLGGALYALGLALDTLLAIGERSAEPVPGTGIAGSTFLVSVTVVGHVPIVPRPGVDASSEDVTTRD